MQQTLEVGDDDPSVCLSCITDSVFTSFIKDICQRGQCVICGRPDIATVHALTLAQVASGVIIEAYEEFDDTLYDYSNGLTLLAVLKRVLAVEDTGFCELVATHLRNQCQESAPAFFAVGVRYGLRLRPFEDRESERDFAAQLWNLRATEFKHRRRYFNEDARKFFARLFDVALEAKNSSIFCATDAARHVLPTGTPIYRCRRVSDAEGREKVRANPDKELGAPPKARAGQNRMNASGIPLFYGALDVQTCIAEVRPSIGDEVAIGLFVTTRGLKFFDFTRFNLPRERDNLSVWHDDYAERLDALILLKYLEHLIGLPVRTGEADYIMTQAMAEFLRFDVDGGFDGIIFGSVQSEGGTNYVIFSERNDAKNLSDPDWHPSFPVGLHPPTKKNGPRFHIVSGIQYRGDWERELPSPPTAWRAAQRR